MLNRISEQKLEMWKTKILRRIFVGKRSEDSWESRTNKEIHELYKESKVTLLIRAQRIQWLRHVVRVEDANEMKRVMKKR